MGILVVFLVIPVGTILIKSVETPQGFSFNYFSLMFANNLLTDAILASLMIGVFSTILCTILTLPLALAFAKFSFPGKSLLNGLLLVPMVMPPFVGAIGIQKFFSRYGSINLLLLNNGWINEPIDFLSEGNKFWAVIILEALHLYPIMFLNLTAALSNVDPSTEEMAETLGVPRWKRFKDIVLPLAFPGYFAGAMIVFIWALTDLGTPLLVGYHDCIPVKIFSFVTDINENPMGYALAAFTVLLTVGIFIASKYFTHGTKYQMLARGHVTSAVRPASGWSLVGIYLLLAVVITSALLPHIGVALTSVAETWFFSYLPSDYTMNHYMHVFAQGLSLTGIKNSFFYAGLSTLVDVALGLMIAYVIARKLVRFSGLLDALVMTPLALPGIVIAFGYVVTFMDTPLDPMEDPVILLVIAYAIRRLPFMVRSAAAGLEQTSSSLEEASYTFGASKFYTLRKITIPLVSANVIAGGLLCFAYAMLDVSDSMILAMKEAYYPLTKVIYVLFLEEGTGEFIACALGVIAIVILGACITLTSRILGKKMGELFRS